MNKNSHFLRLVSFIVIACLLYSNCVYAAGPLDTLARTGVADSPEFRSLIKPLAIVSNLFEKREPSQEDLVFIKSTLIEFLGWDEAGDVTLAYDKKGRKLFIYNKKTIVHFYRDRKTILPEGFIEEDAGGRIAKYRFTGNNEEKIRGIRGVTILEPGEEPGLLLPQAGFLHRVHLGANFWVALTLLTVATVIGLVIYGSYSVVEYVLERGKKRRLSPEGFQAWLEHKRHWLLRVGVFFLGLLPFLRTEFRDIISGFQPRIWVKPEAYSTHMVGHEKVLSIVRRWNKIPPMGKDWERAMAGLRGILEEVDSDLLQTLNNTSIYLVGPGYDVNNPFIFYDRKTGSYIYTFVTGRVRERMERKTRLRRILTTGRYRVVSAESQTQEEPLAIYISEVFYEQISGHRSLVMMLIAEKIMKLAGTPPDKAKEIKARIGGLDTTGITLGNARTIIRNAYFIREREKLTSEWSERLPHERLRKMILRIIAWTERFHGWWHFMKAFMAEFFTITLNWLRTPFIYPLCENLHCGIPTPGIPLPEYGTYLWAIQMGFSDEAARIMAEADVCVDSITTGWIPRLGDQSRHYNMYLHDSRWSRLRGAAPNGFLQIERVYSGPRGDKEARRNYTSVPQFKIKPDIELSPDKEWSQVNHPDTRLDWAQYELERAVSIYRTGEKRLALECLGRGLHSLQDLVAHSDFDIGPYGTRIHPREMDDPNLDINPEGRFVPSPERRRVKETERLTKDYLKLARQRFLKVDGELALKKGSFEVTTDGQVRRYYFKGDKKGTIESLEHGYWKKENKRFDYTRIIFKGGLAMRQSTNVTYVARVLEAATGISTTISRVDKYPFIQETGSASNPIEEMALEAGYNTHIMVTVGGHVADEFLDRALEIMRDEVFGTEIFDEMGIDPSAGVFENERQRESAIEVSRKREHILGLINKLAMDIERAKKEEKPLAEEALAQRMVSDTYRNINLAIEEGIIGEPYRNSLAAPVYFYLTRLNEIREEISTRPLMPLSSSVPDEPDKTIPGYTKEFLEYGILSGMLPDPLTWYKGMPALLGDDFFISPRRLHSLKTWVQIVEGKRRENPTMSASELRQMVINYYYNTFGEIAARSLGEVELALDTIARGIEMIKPLMKRLMSILSHMPPGQKNIYQEYLKGIVHQRLIATGIVGHGLFVSGIPPPEIQRLLLAEPQVNILDTLGLGQSTASLERTGRYRRVKTWPEIYEYVQALISAGEKPERILVDLDMTVFTPMGYLGSMPWLEQRIKEIGRHRAFWEWGDHERRLERDGFYRLVDRRIPGIIEGWKREGIEVVGFTARMWHKDEYRTDEILKKLGIEFSQIGTVQGIYYHSGVVYTRGQGPQKAEALRRLTSRVGKGPVVLIDDRQINLSNIIQDPELQHVYGVHYLTPALEQLQKMTAQDYIDLGDSAMDYSEVDFAKNYYLNAIERARYLEPGERGSICRRMWSNVSKLRFAKKEKELARSLIRHDRTKHDLNVMDERLKDPYLDLLVREPPITDPEKSMVLYCLINEQTDLEGLKHALRQVRATRRKDGNPKIRTVLASGVASAMFRWRLEKSGLIEGIDYDLWYVLEERKRLEDVLKERFEELRSLPGIDIVHISVYNPQQSIPQLIYKGIAGAEGSAPPHVRDKEISPFTGIDLVSLREEAKKKAELLSTHKKGTPYVLFYNTDTDSIAAAAAEGKFLSRCFGMKVIYIPRPIPHPAGERLKSHPYSLYTTILNGEVLRQTRGLTSAGLYLEQTSWLAALGIYGSNASSAWTEYLSSYGFDKMGLEGLAGRIGLACTIDQKAAQQALRDLIDAREPTATLSKEFESMVEVFPHRFPRYIRDAFAVELRKRGYDQRDVYSIIWYGLTFIGIRTGKIGFREKVFFKIAADVLSKELGRDITPEQVMAVLEYHEEIHRRLSLRKNRGKVEDLEKSLLEDDYYGELSRYFQNQYGAYHSEVDVIKELVVNFYVENRIFANPLRLLDDSGVRTPLEEFRPRVIGLIKHYTERIVQGIDINKLQYGRFIPEPPVPAPEERPVAERSIGRTLYEYIQRIIREGHCKNIPWKRIANERGMETKAVVEAVFLYLYQLHNGDLDKVAESLWMMPWSLRTGIIWKYGIRVPTAVSSPVPGDGNGGGIGGPGLFMAGRSQRDVYALASLRYRYLYDSGFAHHDYGNVMQDIETLIRFDNKGKPIQGSINRTNLFLLRLELERRKESMWSRRLVLFSTKKDIDLDPALEMLGLSDNEDIEVIRREHYEDLIRGPNVAGALIMHYPLAIHSRVEVLTIEGNYDLWKSWLDLPVKFVDNRRLPVDALLNRELGRIGLETLIQEDEKGLSYIDISHEIPSLSRIDMRRLRKQIEADEKNQPDRDSRADIRGLVPPADTLLSIRKRDGDEGGLFVEAMFMLFIFVAAVLLLYCLTGTLVWAIAGAVGFFVAILCVFWCIEVYMERNERRTMDEEGRLEGRVVRELKAALVDGDSNMKMWAAEVLAKNGDEEGIKYLISGLGSTKREEVILAMRRLKRLGYRFQDTPAGLDEPREVIISEFQSGYASKGNISYIVYTRVRGSKQWMGKPKPNIGGAPDSKVDSAIMESIKKGEAYEIIKGDSGWEIIQIRYDRTKGKKKRFAGTKKKVDIQEMGFTDERIRRLDIAIERLEGEGVDIRDTRFSFIADRNALFWNKDIDRSSLIHRGLGRIWHAQNHLLKLLDLPSDNMLLEDYIRHEVVAHGDTDYSHETDPKYKALEERILVYLGYYRIVRLGDTGVELTEERIRRDILEIHRSLRGSYSLFYDHHPGIKRYLMKIFHGEEKGVEVFFAVSDTGKIIGYAIIEYSSSWYLQVKEKTLAMLHRGRWRRLLKDDKLAHLSFIAVHPGFQDEGVGSNLLVGLLDSAAGAGRGGYGYCNEKTGSLRFYIVAAGRLGFNLVIFDIGTERKIVFCRRKAGRAGSDVQGLTLNIDSSI